MLTTTIIAQDCPSGSGLIYFENQEQIDQFIIDYPNCKYLDSQLLINEEFGEVITDLSPFNNLVSVRGLALRSLGDPITPGLINLQHINGGLQVFQTELTNLDFLSKVDLIDADNNVTIRIDQNPLLEDISGIINVEPDSIYTISIRNNPLLAVCHYSFVCEMLSRPPPPIGNHRVQFNAIGCEDIDAILAQCDDPIEPPEDPVDPNLCPITSRPGMQINKKEDDTYDVMYLYGSERMKIENVDYTTLAELIYYHKVEKDLLFDFSSFRLSSYCEMAERIIQGQNYDYELSNDPLLYFDETVTMREIEFFKDFVMTMKISECVKI